MPTPPYKINVTNLRQSIKSNTRNWNIFIPHFTVKYVTIYSNFYNFLASFMHKWCKKIFQSTNSHTLQLYYVIFSISSQHNVKKTWCVIFTLSYTKKVMLLIIFPCKVWGLYSGIWRTTTFWDMTLHHCVSGTQCSFEMSGTVTQWCSITSQKKGHLTSLLAFNMFTCINRSFLTTFTCYFCNFMQEINGEVKNSLSTHTFHFQKFCTNSQH